MKNKKIVSSFTSLLIGVLLGGIIYVSAQGAPSIINMFQEADQEFDYRSDLNPADDPLDVRSGPLAGKKTGDVLTASEFNRALELLDQGNGSNQTGNTRYDTWPSRIICDDGSDWEMLYKGRYNNTNNEIWYGTVGRGTAGSIAYDFTTGAHVNDSNSSSIWAWTDCDGKSLTQLETNGQVIW